MFGEGLNVLPCLMLRNSHLTYELIDILCCLLKHNNLSFCRKSVNHDDFTHEDVQTIITASHKSAAVDREFQRDPNRKAKPYEIRSPGKGEY